MSDIAIKVENLSKRYRIGLKEDINDTFVGAIASVVRNPIINLQKLQSLSRFGENEVAEDILWALKDVSFEVKKGEVIGIIGRNGAGKSTLLKILSRITHPTSGRVELNGRVASLLEVGTGFHPEMTGRENIYLNGTILGMRKKEIDRKIEEIIDFSGVEKFIDTPVKRYSSGMRMRLAFSVAAHLEPEILLIDEVLAVGDAEFQKKCLGKMGEVAAGGRTIIFVSHNMLAVEQLCEQGILLSAGEIVDVGVVDKIINKYLTKTNIFTQKFSEIQGINNNNYIKLIDIMMSGHNKNGFESTVIRSGDTINIQIILDVEKNMKNMSISLGINNNHNYRIATLNNNVSGFRLSLDKGKNSVICSIPDINIVEGNYNFDIKIYENRQPILFAQNFYKFIIQPGNIYNNGKLPESSWGGVCHLIQKWERDNFI